MKNSKLVHYLNEGVKVKWKWIDESDYKNTNLTNVYSIINDFTIQVTPYLYPLSCLTESIPYDGRMVVPLVELAKVEGTYKDGEYYLIEGDWFIQSRYKLRYSTIKKSFECMSISCLEDYTIDNQLSLFQLLLKMRINIFPDEIESIDPRTELVNPYL